MHGLKGGAAGAYPATGTGTRNSVGADVRRAIQGGLRHGAAERIADRLERSRRWVYEEIEGRMDGTLDLFAESLSEVSHATAKHALALLSEPLGLNVVETLSGSEADHGLAFQRAVAEIGDIARVAAREPGPLTPALAREIDAEVVEAIEALQNYRRALPIGSVR